MRLDPIYRPRPLIIKVAYYFSRKIFGKVLSPLHIIYSRSVPIFSVARKIVETDKKLSLDRNINLLVRNFVSHFNDCKFCSNSIEYISQKERFDSMKIRDLMSFRKSNIYSEKEKSVLAYVEEITTTKSATLDSFNNLKTHFNEKEIIEITWVCASENYFNMQAKPLGITSDELK